MKSNKLIFHLLAILTVTVWGTTFVATKVLINSGLTPAVIFFCRFLIAYLLMLAFCHRRMFADNVKDEAMLILCGITGGSLYFFTENTALSLTRASDVALIICASPILTIFLDRLFFGGKLKAMMLVGALISFTGVGMVVSGGMQEGGFDILGDVLSFAAGLSWAFYCLCLKKVGKKYSNGFVTRKVFGYGLLTILVVFLFQPPVVELTVFEMPKVAYNLLFLAIVASLGGYLTWNKTVKELGAEATSNYLYLQPLMTIVSASIVLDERLTVNVAIGALMIIGGLVLAEKSSHKKSRQLNASNAKSL